MGQYLLARTISIFAKKVSKMCNSWNHPPGCACGWGGDGHLGGGGSAGRFWKAGSSGGVITLRYSSAMPNDFSSSTDVASGFGFGSTNPNARCPVCDAPVFFFQSESGGRVFFDDLGPPWPKHPCTDNPVAKKNTVIAYDGAPSKKCGAKKWRVLEHVIIHHEDGFLFVKGLAHELGEEGSFYFNGACKLAGKFLVGDTVFIHETPPKNGIWRAILLCWDNFSGVMFKNISLYLEASIQDDIQSWVQAIKGNPWDQNRVGWMLSFGRKKNGVTDASQLTWVISKHWFERSASQDCWAGDHNLGVMLFEGLGGRADEDAAFFHLKKAARSLNPSSISRYAQCYRQGVGCVKNIEIAEALEKIASFEPVSDDEC